VRVTGLSGAEAARLLVTEGVNEIQREVGPGPLRMLVRQFASPLIALLGVACAVALALGEVVDAIAISTIVVVNGLVGFFQEYRAEQAVTALRAMTAPRARVVRDGHAVQIAAREVVPGDLLLLEAGDVVAADAQVVEAHALRTQEAMLTGESQPVDKSAEPCPADAPLAERTDTVFAGTVVANGQGSARVRATGMGTELGRIAHLLASAQDDGTPLQKQLAATSTTLLKICLGIVAAVGALGLLRGQGWLEVLLSAVSLAVAAVPEGLPAVVTLALALGVRRMAERHVLVRRLPAVETLGSATVICTDKTGTLTTGRMVVREQWGPDLRALLYVGVACNDADLAGQSGDPTELALLKAGAEEGLARAEVEAENPRVQVLPFDSTRKRMSVLRADGQLYVKGALDLLLPLCVDPPAGVHEAHLGMAERGLRVLGLARGQGGEERGLTLVGLLGLADPPRPEAVRAVAEARSAGITTVMITGDHPVTAAAIAREIGILREGEPAAERVHARVTPEEKLAIVRGWKERGAVVAMTGDGVNDAPALREAHIGIAMGRTGAEVTREAADLILTDDNFASIVAAIREGRAIYDNIRKTVIYLLSGNAGELIIMLSAAIFGLPAPLLPLHLLWINLVTDGLPALALVVDPPSASVLDRPPRDPVRPMLDRAAWLLILRIGVVEAAVVLSVFGWALSREGEVVARTLAFSTLVWSEVFRSFAARDPDRVLWEVGIFSNKRLLGVVVGSCVVQVGLLLFPPARVLFGLAELSPLAILACFGLGLVPVTLLELAKLIGRLFRPRTR
jgi:Ca2+-transporting ATPase